MKECELCDKVIAIYYMVKSVKFKSWIFCCKKYWQIVSKESQYSYGGTLKIKNVELI